MRLLGAVLAGGASRRFGSDKASASLDGLPMLDRVLDVLRPQVSAVVVCGRSWRGETALPDRPDGRLGPLAGLNAALHHARTCRLDAVLCVPVDVHPLPPSLASWLAGRGARVLDAQHCIGFWPVRHAPALDEYLAGGGRSVGGWIEASGAVRARFDDLELVNVNAPDDMRRAGAARPRGGSMERARPAPLNCSG